MTNTITCGKCGGTAYISPHSDLAPGWVRVPGTGPCCAPCFDLIFDETTNARKQPETNGTIHKLKTWNPYYTEVDTGAKTFEVRKNDRGYRKDDILCLQEWDSYNESYSGRQCFRKVTHILQGGSFGIEEGYVVLSLAHVK